MSKPFWMPDTQGFLAIAILLIMGGVVFVMLFHKADMDQLSQGVLMTVIGVLVGSLKDVYSFFFGSSRGSEKKDDALISGAVSPTSTPPIVPPSQPIGLMDTPAAKLLVLFAVLLTGLVIFGSGSALAQTRLKLPIDPLGLNDRPALSGGGGGLGNILGALDDKLLPDLQYALKLAQATNSRVTAPCYQAWIDIIQTRQKAVTGPDGAALDLPNPRLITDFEKAVELRNSLQPDSQFMISCSPVASMVKSDIIGFIGKVLAGGAGLAAMVPGL